MKQKRLGKKIIAWLMCLAMVLTIVNLLAFTTEVKAEEHTPTPLTFTAEKDGSTISLTWLEGSEVQYSTNGDENWNDYTEGESITLTNKGDTVSFKGKNVKTGYCYNESEGTGYFKKFVMKGKISASGDVTSLTNAKGGDVALEAGCYDSMFDSCDSLTSAPNLPSTTLADSCYSYMFYECTSLVDAPTLGATILADNCYNSMFYGCKNLSSAPALPATTLAESCYQNMFYGCTSLSNAPALSATTLAEGCYQGIGK